MWLSRGTGCSTIHHGWATRIRLMPGGPWRARRLDQPDSQASLFADLAQGGLLLGLVRLDMAARDRQPPEERMLDQPEPPVRRQLAEDEHARGRMLDGHRIIVP